VRSEGTRGSAAVGTAAVVWLATVGKVALARPLPGGRNRGQGSWRGRRMGGTCGVRGNGAGGSAAAGTAAGACLAKPGNMALARPLLRGLESGGEQLDGSKQGAALVWWLPAGHSVDWGGGCRLRAVALHTCRSARLEWRLGVRSCTRQRWVPGGHGRQLPVAVKARAGRSAQLEWH